MDDTELAVGEPEVIRMLEQEKEKAIKRDVDAALRQSRELGSDFLALGDKLYRDHPKVWAKVKDDWRDDWLPKIKVDVQVHSRIIRTGLVSNPLPVKE